MNKSDYKRKIKNKWSTRNGRLIRLKEYNTWQWRSILNCHKIWRMVNGKIQRILK
jgi:hypothetical protein